MQTDMMDKRNRYDGGAIMTCLVDLWVGFVSALSLGLAYPAMWCWRCRWRAQHTYINGRRLIFDGKGGDLFGKYVIWLLLSIVTLGLYSLIAMPYRLACWETEHTHIEGVGGESCFKGTMGGLFANQLVAGLVTSVTLGFGSYWAVCYQTSYLRNNQVLDGSRLQFDGTGWKYFCYMFPLQLLTLITLGIFGFWMTVKEINWMLAHIKTDGDFVGSQPQTGEKTDVEAKSVAAGMKTEPQEKKTYVATEEVTMIIRVITVLLFVASVVFLTLTCAQKQLHDAHRTYMWLWLIFEVLSLLASSALMTMPDLEWIGGNKLLNRILGIVLFALTAVQLVLLIHFGVM